MTLSTGVGAHVSRHESLDTRQKSECHMCRVHYSSIPDISVILIPVLPCLLRNHSSLAFLPIRSHSNDNMVVLAYLSRQAFSIKRLKTVIAIAATLIVFTFIYKSAYLSFSPRDASRQALLTGQKCPPDINDDTSTGFFCRIRQAQERA